MDLFHLSYQVLMLQTPGCDHGREGYRVAYNTRHGAHFWLDLLAKLVHAFLDVEDGKGAGNSQPHGRVSKLLPGADAPAEAEDVAGRVKGGIGPQEPRWIKHIGIWVHGRVV